jgi:hypothetical protein
MKPKRFIMVGDNHGDMEDPVTSAALFAFIQDYRPTVRIHGGDCFDFRNLRKGASDDEKADSLKDDWGMGSHFMRRFFNGGKENYLLRGNHDERIYDLQGSATGVMRDYATDCVKQFEQLTKRCRAAMLPYDSRHGILRLGHMKVVHGYFHGKGAAAAHARVYRHCHFFHIHAFYTAPVESDEGPKEASSVGAICQTDMPYNSRQTNKLTHNNGWRYGQMFEDGTYQYWDARRIGDNFYAAQDIKTY